MVTNSSILTWKIHDRGAWQATVQRIAELDMTEHTHACIHILCIHYARIHI